METGTSHRWLAAGDCRDIPARGQLCDWLLLCKSVARAWGLTQRTDSALRPTGRACAGQEAGLSVKSVTHGQWYDNGHVSLALEDRQVGPPVLCTERRADVD